MVFPSSKLEPLDKQVHFDFIEHPMKLGAKKRIEQHRTQLIMMNKRFTDILIDMNCIKID